MIYPLLLMLSQSPVHAETAVECDSGEVCDTGGSDGDDEKDGLCATSGPTEGLMGLISCLALVGLRRRQDSPGA